MQSPGVAAAVDQTRPVKRILYPVGSCALDTDDDPEDCCLHVIVKQ